MGYNTACMLLNDRLHTLPDIPDFGKQVRDTVMTAQRLGGCGPAGFSALPSQHADVVQIVAVGGNRIDLLGTAHWLDEPADMLRRLADQLGYRIVRKPHPKETPHD